MYIHTYDRIQVYKWELIGVDVCVMFSSVWNDWSLFLNISSIVL